MVPSGRYNSCRNCGRMFPEGCVRGEYVCSDKCRKEWAIKEAETKARIQTEINKNKPLVHDYQI
jgi:hypothetical protein